MPRLPRSSSRAVQYILLAMIFAACHSNSEPMGRLKWQGFVDCPESLTVVSNELLARPPYMEKQANSTAYQGLMPIFLEMMLNECCKLSSNLVFVDSEGEANLTLPVLLNVEECRLNNQADLVPMLPNTGVAFVVIKENKGNHSMKLLNSLVGTWPVLVLTLILSVIAGIIAWALDTGTNPEDFPRTFTKGSWEGFWWAFVSMTTVGYGDRCPRSFRGRLFAVVWILVGMCICSIFTATLTTSLTTVSLNTKIDLARAKVVTLLDSLESITGFQRQADMKRVKTARDMHEQLETGDVQGALMDAYFLLYYKANFPTKNLRVQEIISSNLEYGVKVKHTELMNCLRNKRSTMESSFYEHAELHLQQSLTSRLGNEGDELDNLFDPQGLLFYPALFTCLGVTAFLLLVGGVWDTCRLVTCSWMRKERPRGFSLMLTRINCGARSHSTSFYMSQKRLKSLESKVTDLSRMVEAIKDELTLNRQAERSCRNENLSVNRESRL